MKHNIILSLLAVTAFSVTQAQESIGFEQALALTLENNYDIRLAKVNEEVAENNASKSNNNYLPTVVGGANGNINYFDGENRLQDRTVEFDANAAYNFGASVVANYTLFDGLGRRYNYLQSKESLKFTQLQQQQIVQNTILELSQIYHEVARLTESVDFFERSVLISKDRLKRAEYNYEFGQANKLEVLNAKVDLNTDSINLINGLQQLTNQKRNLNFVMGQPVQQEITVSDKVSIKQNILETQVLESISGNNVDLRLAQSSLRLNQIAIGSSKANWLPSVSADAGYYFNGSENPNGAFLIGNRNFGPQAGVSLNWTLFNGRNNVAVKNAKLNLKSQEITKEAAEQNVRSQALNAHTVYKNSLFILRTQADNVLTAEDNFKRSETAYQLGQINSIAFRTAQLNLLQAKQALSQAKYTAKNAELQVLAIMGELVE